MLLIVSEVARDSYYTSNNNIVLSIPHFLSKLSYIQTTSSNLSQ